MCTSLREVMGLASVDMAKVITYVLFVVMLYVDCNLQNIGASHVLLAAHCVKAKLFIPGIPLRFSTFAFSNYLLNS